MLMSADVRFEPIEQWHVAHVAKFMRQADVKEIKLSHNHSPREALFTGLKCSSLSCVALVHDEPVAIFGLVKGCPITGHGVPWMLGTDKLFKHKRKLLEYGKVVVSQMLDECDFLENYVHEENTSYIKWLSVLGFSFDEPKKYGVGGAMFRRFYMKRCSNV